MGIIGAVRIHGFGNGRIHAQGFQVGPALEPDQVVVLTVARRGVDKAGAGVVGDVIAFQEGNLETVIGVKGRQGMGADHACWIDRVQTGPGGDLRRLGYIVRQLVGDDQAVAGPGPGLELQPGLHGRDLIEAIADLFREADRPVGRDGPGRGGPDDHAGLVRPFDHGELHPDGGAVVVVILHLGVGQGGALHRAPHDRL